MKALPDTGASVAAERVSLFGEPSVRSSAGETVRLTPRQLALVAVVYGHGTKGITRPVAAGLLWGPGPGDRWRQRIRQLLHELRGRSAESLIDTPGDILRPASGFSSDLTSCERALRASRLREAAEVVSRGFLAEPIIDSRTFDDWRTALGARLARQLRTRAAQKWTSSVEDSAWAEARDAAEALYRLDPNNPRVIERVIEARGRVGSLEAAEGAFQEYIGSISTHSSRDSDVVEAIDRVRASAKLHIGDRPDAHTRVPFVGRRRELKTIRQALDRVADNSFEVVLISGESGIGKTRLLDEVHREGILRDFRCLRAQPVEIEQSIPLNPILDALSGVELQPHLEAVGRPWSSVIAGLLPPGTFDHAVPPPPIPTGGLSRRLLDSFALLFERLAQERPTLLLVDDLQWADETTVAALRFIQRRWGTGGMGVVSTVRRDLVGPADPVSRYFAAARDSEVTQVQLGSLGTSDALQLIDEMGSGEVDEPSARRLCEMTGRHPLYLTELIREFLGGRLDSSQLASDQVTIPLPLAEMLDARLRAMGGSAAAVASVLAVAHRPLRLAQIVVLTDLRQDQAASATETLISERFVEMEGDHFRIAHDLFRSAIYRRLSGPRRAVHHEAIATQLITDAPIEAAGEAAIHYARAGEDRLAARYGWGAARRALEAGAVAEAARFFEVVADLEGDPERRAAATEGLAQSLHLTRDITRAAPTLRLGAERLRSVGQAHRARRLEIMRVEGLAELARSPVEELLRGLGTIKAEGRAEGDWEAVALALDAELHLLHRGGNVAGIQVRLQEMREVSKQTTPSVQLLCQAGLALGVFFGDPEEALRAAQSALRLAEQTNGYRLRALIRLMVVLQARGRLLLPDASQYLAEARSLAERNGDVLARFSIESNLAAARLDAGDVDGAEALMADVGRLAGAGEMDINRFVQANNEAGLWLVREDFDQATSAFAEAATFLGPTIPGYMHDLVNAGLGFCALETGDLAEARRREGLLGPSPASWYFDPTMLVAFRARLLERRGQGGAALSLLKDVAESLEGRLPTAWLKVTLLIVRLLAKAAPREGKQMAEEMSEAAARLQMPHRERDFRQVAAQL